MTAGLVGPADRVWYFCYGSNLSWERFRCYLEGGRPPGSTRAQPGARDREPPAAWRAVTRPGRVYFARYSEAWGGAVAFYDPDGPGDTPGRAYLLRPGQLADVAAQENGRAPGRDLDLDLVRAAGAVDVGTGWYDRVVHLGEIDERPVFTLTAPWPAAGEPVASPSSRYLATVGRGLVETHGLSPAEAGRHLASLPGCAGVWWPDGVAGLLEAPAPGRSPDLPDCRPGSNG